MFAVLLAFLTNPPPNTPLPHPVEQCIYQAEVCVQADVLGVCGEVELNCSSQYSACVAPYPEAQLELCRNTYARCVLFYWPNPAAVR